MGSTVLGIGMSHAPGLLAFPDTPPPEQSRRMEEAIGQLADRLREAAPDVIIALLDDHFDNHFRGLMPTFSIATGDVHHGPGEHYLEFLRLKEQRAYPGHPELAEELLAGFVAAGFDVTRMGTVEYGNNLVVPLEVLGYDAPVPIVPIFVNVFTSPQPTPARVVEFGRCLGRLIEASGQRVALLATGGLSHWPPFWFDDSPEDDEFLARMKTFQTTGREVLEADPGLYSDLGRREAEMARQADQLVAPEWDREVLGLLAADDTTGLSRLTIDGIRRDGGTGGLEVLLWLCLRGAMERGRFELLCYEPVPEWICGMAFAAVHPVAT